MEVNCENCGACCYSRIPDSVLKGERIIQSDDREVDLKTRKNIILLTHDEVSSFWHAGLGNFLSIASAGPKGGYTLIQLTIANIPKFVDNDWVLACPFFDPKDKNCRIYGTEIYPNGCEIYPFNLLLEGIKPLCEGTKLVGEITQKQTDIIQQINSEINAKCSFIIQEPFGDFQRRLTYQHNHIIFTVQLLYKLYGKPKMIQIERVNKELILQKFSEELEYEKKHFNK